MEKGVGELYLRHCYAEEHALSRLQTPEVNHTGMFCHWQRLDEHSNGGTLGPGPPCTQRMFHFAFCLFTSRVNDPRAQHDHLSTSGNCD